MSPGLVFALVGAILAAGVLYYLYIVRRWPDWDAGARASIVVLVGVFIPILILALWNQHGAKDQLASHGIEPHPDLGPSIGVATGSETSGHSWMFEFDGSEDALLDFYRDTANRPGWSLTGDDETVIILARDDHRMSISRGDDGAIFLLYESKQ